MIARQMPSASIRRRVRASAWAIVDQGFVSGAKMAAADAIRNHATPSTPTAGKSKTAKAGPR